MFVPKLAVIEKLWNAGSGPAHLHKQLAAIQMTVTTIRRLRKQRTDLQERHRAEIDEIDMLIRKEQMACKHLDQTFHGDPSGGNDSHTVCNVCDAEL